MHQSIASNLHAGDEPPLKGLRLLVTDLDLQQREHRGIAVYSKAVLKALKASGAETWLLTDLDPRLSERGLKHLPRPTQRIVFAARVMEGLMIGHAGLRSQYWDAKLKKKSSLARLRSLWLLLQDLIDQALPRRYQLSRLTRVDLDEHLDSPYLRQERLSYLNDINGIICARHLYFNASRCALGRNPRALSIELGNDFDGLISTCPLNLRIQDTGIFVQTVHDLIPIEYVPHLDHVALFGHRLASSVPARKLFVSAATREKFKKAFPSPNDPGGAVVIQPPSLQISGESNIILPEQDVLCTCSGTKASQSKLIPFRYLLFNSSVEPRKNLLFAIKAFKMSGLAEQGIQLCITGRLRNDAYSEAVKEQVDNAIVLTNYIDEHTKATLFLHTIAVLSPSLVEGFGIPVLDGACIGSSVIASPSASHREIQSMYDFHDLILLRETHDPTIWASTIAQVAQSQQNRITDPSRERDQRIKRYLTFSQCISEKFKETICNQILVDLKSKRANNDVRDLSARPLAKHLQY